MKSVLISLKETKYQILIIVILTFGVYFNSLFNHFVWDDHLFIDQWPVIRSFDNVGEVLRGSAPPAQGKIYRPVRGLIYMVDWQIFGANPFWYRLQAVLLHVGVTVLVYLITKELLNAKRLTTNAKQVQNAERSTTNAGTGVAALSVSQSALSAVPFITALIFGLHPIHTETIDYISTSLETFGSLFFFGSFYLYIYANSMRMKIVRMDANKEVIMRVGSVALAFLAFFTYEMTLTLPVLLVLYEWCFGRLHLRGAKAYLGGGQWLVYLPYFAAAAGFVVVRTMILGLVSRTDYLGYSFYLTMVTMVKVFARYIGLMILPLNQTAIHNLVGDFPASMIPYDKLDPILSQTIFDLPVILAILVIALSILVAIKVVRLYPFVTFGIIWFWTSLLPVSYIIPHGGAMAEKYLYIASFGFLLAVASIYANGMRMKILRMDANIYQQALIGVGVMLVLFYSVSTIARNRVWHDDISLFSDVVKKSPNNLLANYTLGIWYTGARNFEASEAHYLRVLSIAPEFWEARFNLANNYLRTNQAQKAKEQYRTILNVYPAHKPAKNILANVDLIAESSPSAQPAGDLAVNYKTEGGLKFSFPAYWSIDPSTSSGKIVLKDAEETLTVSIFDAKPYRGNVEDYIKSLKENLGTLVNQGLAQIPNVQSAFVKVWEGSKDEGLRISDEVKVTKLQFFLFSKEKVVQILVWPVPQTPASPDGGLGGPVMAQFNGILGSISINAN